MESLKPVYSNFSFLLVEHNVIEGMRSMTWEHHRSDNDGMLHMKQLLSGVSVVEVISIVVYIFVLLYNLSQVTDSIEII